MPDSRGEWPNYPLTIVVIILIVIGDYINETVAPGTGESCWPVAVSILFKGVPWLYCKWYNFFWS